MDVSGGSKKKCTHFKCWLLQAILGAPKHEFSLDSNRQKCIEQNEKWCLRQNNPKHTTLLIWRKSSLINVGVNRWRKRLCHFMGNKNRERHHVHPQDNYGLCEALLKQVLVTMWDSKQIYQKYGTASSILWRLDMFLRWGTL